MKPVDVIAPDDALAAKKVYIMPIIWEILEVMILYVLLKDEKMILTRRRDKKKIKRGKGNLYLDIPTL